MEFKHMPHVVFCHGIR